MNEKYLNCLIRTISNPLKGKLPGDFRVNHVCRKIRKRTPKPNIYLREQSLSFLPRHIRVSTASRPTSRKKMASWGACGNRRSRGLTNVFAVPTGQQTSTVCRLGLSGYRMGRIGTVLLRSRCST
eukprot:UN24324